MARRRKNFQQVPAFTKWLMLLVSLLLPAGCGKKKEAPPPLPKVTVAQPVRREVVDYLELTGNTQAVNTVQLVARVAGYLDKVLFRDGQMVRKGDPLFIIQQSTYEASVRQAEGQALALKAQLEYAQKQLTRYTHLLPLEAAAKTDVDNWRYQRDSAGANLKAAEANRDLARLNLGYTRVAAPFNGRIDRRLQDPGNLVGSAASNSTLAQLSQIDPIYVYFTISDADLARFMENAHRLPGQGNAGKRPVYVGLTKEEGYPHEGRLDFAATSLTATTGSLLMRGILPNPAGRILPGLYARVRVPLEKKSALLVPDTAVSSDQQGSYVLVVNGNNVVERHGVKTGTRVDNLRVVEEGLTGKELVVIQGLLKARPGSKVTTQLENSPSAAAPPRPPGKQVER